MTAVVSKLENFLVRTSEVAEQAFSFDKLSIEAAGESVNNYFKSMKEIEAEFIASMNAAKTTIKNMISDIGHFGQHLIHLDGDINFPDPDDIHNGFMEENY